VFLLQVALFGRNGIIFVGRMNGCMQIDVELMDGAGDDISPVEISARLEINVLHQRIIF
jgi:hypothetical protein